MFEERRSGSRNKRANQKQKVQRNTPTCARRLSRSLSVDDSSDQSPVQSLQQSLIPSSLCAKQCPCIHLTLCVPFWEDSHAGQAAVCPNPPGSNKRCRSVCWSKAPSAPPFLRLALPAQCSMHFPSLLLCFLAALVPKNSSCCFSRQSEVVLRRNPFFLVAPLSHIQFVPMFLCCRLKFHSKEHSLSNMHPTVTENCSSTLFHILPRTQWNGVKTS